ncbi:MAG: hypothetical protein JSR82_10855 [Verrucomicrobia bacterium]|nr:hypothetical protein [Verrucomicrobiota bacterium]
MDFPTTRWTQLALRTAGGGDAEARAFGHLCERYRDAILEFLRWRGIRPDEVEDVAHDFLLHLQERETLRRVDRDRGRFRSFLLGALKRFLGDRADRLAAQKRGGAVTTVSLDSLAPDSVPAGEQAAVDAFDERWARELLGHALQRLHDDWREVGHFAVLRRFLPGSTDVPPYEEAARSAGLSLAALKSDVHRVRGAFRTLLRREVALTVGAPDEVDGEMALLQRALMGGHGAPT